jgi:hypothetical protein
MDTLSTVDELIGVILFLAIVLLAVRPVLELERLVARRAAGVTAADVKSGRARYRRQATGTLVVRVHPSIRAAR